MGKGAMKKGKLIFVSNRLPVTVEKKKEVINYKQSMGGLATGLGSFYQAYDSVWIGWSGTASESITEGEKADIEKKLLEEHKSCPVFLTREEVREYYYGFCNRTIWPLYHYFPTYTVYDNSFWDAYVKVNLKFCEAVVDCAEVGDTIWVHDYQLMLLPELIRQKLERTRIGFFLHIPFPSFEIFRLLPWRREILRGLLGADLVGFHTYDYVRHFLSSVRRLLGHEHRFNNVFTDRRVICADVFPMGIDYERYSGAPQDEKVSREIDAVEKRLGGRRAILSVDRLDYTKGIIHRLEAFHHFLQTYPEYRDRVTLILIAVPSRTGVDTYMHLKRELDERIGRINGKYGTIGWTPIWYLYRALPFHALTALYYVADVALVTPLRDGMNLIAKEYVATKGSRPGCLILSGMAGAVHELGEAIVVNPHNVEQVSSAIKQALEMPLQEQVGANAVMQARLKRYNVVRWAHDFVERLDATDRYQAQFYEQRFTSSVREALLGDYRNAAKRLLLLDYDGTLIPFADKPDKAKPDEGLLAMLTRLLETGKTEVVVISGRDRETLGRWFDGLEVSLIAEHGVWVKEGNGSWRERGTMNEDWKEAIRPVLELYMDRTPGSLIEEKSYSLAWHYRMTDPDLAAVRVNELKETLLNMTENLNLGILEGNKVIEVKVAGINKGSAAIHWLSNKQWDFILAMGDDVTDEDTFDVLPPHAYSIKVGAGLTKARFNVLEVKDVRMLLQDLVESKT